MAFTRSKYAVPLFKAKTLSLLFFAVVLQSCTSDKKIYKSDCDEDITYKHVGFTQLIDSIQKYDQQYVEVSGTYKEGKQQSALVNDSLFVNHSDSHAVWVNFSQDCPLYLSGTRIGLFEYNNGKFTQINNKKVTIRGKVDVKQKGRSKSYKGCIDRVSFVEM